MYIRVVLLDFIEMVLTLEQETRIRNEKKRKIMSLRMDPEIIPDLIEKGIAGFSTDYVLKRKIVTLTLHFSLFFLVCQWFSDFIPFLFNFYYFLIWITQFLL